jgi:hypothetical protein
MNTHQTVTDFSTPPAAGRRGRSPIAKQAHEEKKPPRTEFQVHGPCRDAAVVPRTCGIERVRREAFWKVTKLRFFDACAISTDRTFV